MKAVVIQRDFDIPYGTILEARLYHSSTELVEVKVDLYKDFKWLAFKKNRFIIVDDKHSKIIQLAFS